MGKKQQHQQPIIIAYYFDVAIVMLYFFRDSDLSLVYQHESRSRSIKKNNQVAIRAEFPLILLRNKNLSRIHPPNKERIQIQIQIYLVFEPNSLRKLISQISLFQIKMIENNIKVQYFHPQHGKIRPSNNAIFFQICVDVDLDLGIYLNAPQSKHFTVFVSFFVLFCFCLLFFFLWLFFGCQCQSSSRLVRHRHYETSAGTGWPGVSIM